MSRIYRKGISGGEGSGSSFIESVSESFEVVLKELKLKAEGVTNTFLGRESVTNEKVKLKSLEGNRLAKETLGNEEIQTNAINARTIEAGAVEESEIGVEAVSATKIKAEAVETSKIKNLAVTTGKLAAAVTEKLVISGGTTGQVLTRKKTGEETQEWKTFTPGLTEAEIEAARFKKLIPEKIEKLKELVGEALKVTKVASMVGEAPETTGTASITGFNKIAGYNLRANAYFSTNATTEAPAGSVANNYEPEHAAVFYAFATEEATFTFTGWTKSPINLAAVQAGQQLIIYNNNTVASKKLLLIVNESAESAGENQFALFGSEIALAPHQFVLFYYQGGKWRLSASSTSATTPVPSATEKTIVSGVAGFVRKRTFALTGDNSKKEWKLEHKLETQAITASSQTSVSEKPSEVALLKTVATNENEVTVTFEKAPKAKEVFFVTVVG